MALNAEIVAHSVKAFTKITARFAGSLRRRIAARRRRIEHDAEFYRTLNAYCRANNLPPVCEDDWRTRD